MAASLLGAIGLPGLIADHADDYAARAVALALNPDRTTALKRKLAANRATTRLFDAAGYTRHLEPTKR